MECNLALDQSSSTFRIGILALLTNEGHSGLGQYIINLVHALGQVDAKNHYVIFKLQGDTSLDPLEGPNISICEVNTRWKHPLLSIVWHMFFLPILAKKYFLNVVHLPSYRRPIFWLHCPFIVTVHDMAIFRIPGKYGLLRYLFHRLITASFLQKARHIVTVSEASKNDILKFMEINDVPISVVQNGINHAEFYCRDKKESQDLILSQLDVNFPIILCVSRLEHPGKNLVRLIEAFSILKKRHNISHKLVIAGSPWNGSPVVFLAAQNSQYSKEILFPGFVPQANLPILYNAADMFVFPTLWEGFGFPVLEAMACGIPVACSNVASLPEIVDDAAQLFDPTDVEEIVRAMSLCLNYESKQISRGLKQADQFSWLVASKSILRLYEE